jgi:hypothetical protein
MDLWWNNTEMKKLTHLKRNLSHCYCVYQKSHIDCGWCMEFSRKHLDRLWYQPNLLLSRYR